MFRTQRRKYPWNRNTGPDRSTQRAIVDHDLFSGQNVGCDCAEGRGKSIEVVARPVGCAKRELIEELMYLLSGEDSIRQFQFELFEVHCKHLPVGHCLAIHVRVAAVRAVAGNLPPVGFEDHPLEIVNGISRGVQTPDQGAITHSHDHIDRYAFALQYAQYADMRASPRAASTEHKRDLWPLFRKRGMCAEHGKSAT